MLKNSLKPNAEMQKKGKASRAQKTQRRKAAKGKAQ
jgi:hypothetical protein